MTNSCAIYIRKSRQKDEGKTAYRLEAQRDDLPAYAQAQGWKPQVYDDGIASGADASKLPQLQRLLDNLATIDVILCIEFSRLSRDESLIDFAKFLDLCVQHQVKIATPGTMRDPGNPQEWMMCVLEGSFSATEMKVIRIRMDEGRRKARDDGKWLGGIPPFGYCLNGHGLELHPQESEAVRAAISLAREHSAYAIAQRLVAEGHTARSGAPFTERIVRRMLEPGKLLRYTGQTHNSAGRIIRADWPAIIPDADRQAILAAKRSRMNRAGQSHPLYLLTGMGILKCGYCGCTVKSERSTRNGSTRRYYYCSAGQQNVDCPRSRSIRMEVADRLVQQSLAATLRDPERLQQYYQTWLQRRAASDAADRIRKQIRATEQKQQNVVEAIADGTLTRDLARARLAEYETQLATLGQQLAEVGAEPAFPIAEVLSLFRGDAIAEFLAAAPNDQRRELVRLCLSRIELTVEALTLTYRFPITSEGDMTESISLAGLIIDRRTRKGWTRREHNTSVTLAEFLRDHGPASIEEMAEALGVSTGTAYAYFGYARANLPDWDLTTDGKRPRRYMAREK